MRGLKKIGQMVKYYICLQREMEFEFVKNAKKQGKFQFTRNSNCACLDKIL
jgi:hypothetical protein